MKKRKKKTCRTTNMHHSLTHTNSASAVPAHSSKHSGVTRSYLMLAVCVCIRMYTHACVGGKNLILFFV